MGEQPRGKPEPPRARRPAGTMAPPPWLPVPLTIEAVGAVQALMRGEAAPHQQTMALAFIINVICERDDMSYRPGPDGDRDTAFAEGKRYVGNQIVKMTKIDPRIFDKPRGE